MVAGDKTCLRVEVDAGARCFLGSQSSTKIYRNPSGLPCAHELHATVGEEALLVLAPDPVQCFAESAYEQIQRFDLAATANLVVVDWFSGGRAARGEQWQFRRYASRNEVYREGRLILLDPLRIDFESAGTRLPFATGRFHCFATVFLAGPKFAHSARQILDELASAPLERGAPVMVTASPLADGVILRLAATTVETTAHAIQARLSFLSKLLSDNPWERKW